MLAQSEFTLEGKQCVLQSLPTSRGIQAAIVIGHIMAGATDGFTRAGAVDMVAIGAASIAGVLQRLEPNSHPTFVRSLVIESMLQPKMIESDYEAFFSARYDLLWDVVERIVALNGWVDIVKKKLPAIMAKSFLGGEEKPTSSTPSTSNPSSPN